jgi:hypothetical protein
MAEGNFGAKMAGAVISGAASGGGFIGGIARGLKVGGNAITGVAKNISKFYNPSPKKNRFRKAKCAPAVPNPTK